MIKLTFISEVINPFIKTRNQVLGRNGEWIDEREKRYTLKNSWANLKQIGLGEKEVIFETWDKEIILESFVFTDLIDSTTSRIYPTLHITEGQTAAYNSQIFFNTLLEGDTGSRTLPSGINIKNGYSQQLELQHSETLEGQTLYIVSLRNPIVLPKGGRLAMNNPSSGNSASQFSYSAIWREEE